MPRRSEFANLRWYQRYQLFAGALFWAPTVVLFLIERVGLAQALSIQAAYYIAVVFLELPTGWVSDRLGRVLALRLVALCWIGAHGLFIVATSVAELVVAQVLLAAGYALVSGTDVTFHYDTLETLNQTEEFAKREARSRQGLLVMSAASALIGGLVGLVDLRLPFVLSGLAAAAQGLVALRLVEPGFKRSPAARSAPLEVLKMLRHRAVSWVMFFLVFQVVAVHLISDLSGPFLAEAIGSPTVRGAAFVTGISAACGALVGALVVGKVPGLTERFGAPATLLAAGVAPVVILCLMNTFSSIWTLALLPLRVLPRTAASVIAPEIVGRHVPRENRATMLSIASLGGRLVFGATVAVFGLYTLDLNRSLLAAAVLAALLWCVALGLRVFTLSPTDFKGDSEFVRHGNRHLHWHVHLGSHGHHQFGVPMRGLRVHRHHHQHHQTHSSSP